MATNVTPYEVVAGPAKVYLAPVGTAFPAIDDLEAAFDAAWVALGKTDGGVKVSHSQTIVPLRVDQVTAPVKAVRSEEDLVVEFSIVELTLENYATVMNQLVEGPTANAGDKEINLYRGGSGIETVALFVRGDHLSPYGDYNLQYEVPTVYQSSSPEVDFTKDAKSLLTCAFTAIAASAFVDGTDDADIFGVLRAGTA
jgi:hypothetical protein